MNKKSKELRAGLRLDIKKPPKVEIPKNLYNRKVKHKKGPENEKFGPFFYIFPADLNLLFFLNPQSSRRITSLYSAM